MGLFSKEACAFCGKEVGVMHRSKMSDKNYICTDCKFLTHPFIRIDKVSTEEAQALMDEVARDEEYFQTVNWDKIIRHSPTKNYVFYFSRDTGEFAFHTPETEKYKNHPIFQMIMVRPFDRNLVRSIEDGTAGRLQPLTADQYRSLITLKEKKNSEGKIEGWEMYIPYLREDMDISIDFPGNTKESEVRGFYDQVVNTIVGFNTGTVQRRETMHQINAAKTAGSVLKAALKGEDAESIAAKLQEGMETSEGIDTGKVKRGLFGGLKKK